MIFLLLAVGCLAPALGQFGGYDPPAPICKAFSCPAGEQAVGHPEHQIWSYGCKESGMNVFNMQSFNPNDPLAGMKGASKNLNKCCVEKDICKQTCGMTSKACHESFKKCSNKVCKGDQNCQLQAMMADIMSEPYDPEEEKKGKDDKYDPDALKCKGYLRGQNDACKCVPKKDFRSATETHLKAFYGKYNPEKLTIGGDIKDVDEVWKKWKGKEPELFVALATKYKDKVVEMREKPKPPPSSAPKDSEPETNPDEMFARAKEKSEEKEKEKEKKSALDADDRRFEEKRKDLEKQKKKAAKDEDYDKADQLKEEVKALRETEMERLDQKKARAIADEDYAEAKRVKDRLAKLKNEL